MKRGLDNHADRQQGDEDLEGNKEKLFGNFLPEFRAGIRAGDHRYNHQQYEQQVRAKGEPEKSEGDDFEEMDNCHESRTGGDQLVTAQAGTYQEGHVEWPGGADEKGQKRLHETET